MREHGLESQLIARKYQLGVVIDPLPGDERFEGWLSIPYLTKAGCRSIRFRRLIGDGSKIGQAKGQPVRIYNPEACFTAGEVIGITEGEMDAIAATELLGLPSVGIPGAKMWVAYSGVWKPMFKNFERVLVLRDGDEDGKDLADAITESLGTRARVIDMPDGEDVSSMLVQGRASELTKQFKEDDDDGSSD